MLRKTDDDKSSAYETKLKVYFYRLVGKELYVYKKENSDKHKGMHNLAGVFLKNVREEEKFDTTTLYSFKLIFPQGKERQYYFTSKTQKEEWMKVIKEATGSADVFDYYDIVDETLGTGISGSVHTGYHKETG